MQPFFIIVGILLMAFAVSYSFRSQKKIREGQPGGERAHQEGGDIPGDRSSAISQQQTQTSSHHHGGVGGGHHHGGFGGGHHSGGFGGGGGGGHAH